MGQGREVALGDAIALHSLLQTQDFSPSAPAELRYLCGISKARPRAEQCPHSARPLSNPWLYQGRR